MVLVRETKRTTRSWDDLDLVLGLLVWSSKCPSNDLQLSILLFLKYYHSVILWELIKIIFSVGCIINNQMQSVKQAVIIFEISTACFSSINYNDWQISGAWAWPIFGKLVQNKAFSRKMILKEFRAWYIQISEKLIQIWTSFPEIGLAHVPIFKKPS